MRRNEAFGLDRRSSRPRARYGRIQFHGAIVWPGSAREQLKGRLPASNHQLNFSLQTSAHLADCAPCGVLSEFRFLSIVKLIAR